MKQNSFDKHMSAITFAESGEHETARQILNEIQQEKKVPQAAGNPWARVIILGAVSLLSYGVLFLNQSTVMELFTKGGANTAYPILTVFWFSFVHGAFGSNLLKCLGIEAKSSGH